MCVCVCVCVCDVGPVLMSSALHLAGCQVSASCCCTHLKMLEFTKRLRGLNLRPADFSATLLFFFSCLCSKTQNPLKDSVNVGKKKNKKQNDLPPIVLKLYRFHLLIVLPSSAWVVGDLEVLSSSMHYVQKCLQKWWPLCSFMHVLSCLLQSGLCFFN